MFHNRWGKPAKRKALKNTWIEGSEASKCIMPLRKSTGVIHGPKAIPGKHFSIPSVRQNYGVIATSLMDGWFASVLVMV